MARTEPELLRAVAEQVAGAAAELVAKMRSEAVTSVRTKSSRTDVVTDADTAAEELLRARLRRLRPADAVLGEEGGADRAAQPGQVCWVLDPIDGTVNYLHGSPWYSVSVGATRDGVALAGAVVEPVSGRVWSAGLGRGASLDGRSLRVSSAERLELALIGTGFGYRQELRVRQGALAGALLPRVGDIRRTGSAALDLCAVAAGWVDGYYEHGIEPWDWAAGALIAAEAGAVVALPGAAASLGPRVTLAAAPGIAAELVETLAELGAGSF